MPENLKNEKGDWMGMGGILKAAVIPIALMAIFGIIGSVIWAIPIVNFLTCLTGPAGIVIGVILTAWAGRSAVKNGSGAGGAAVAGALTGFVSTIIVNIASFILVLLGVGVGAAAGAVGKDPNGLANALGGGIFGVGVGFVAGLMGLAFWVFVGAIMGAIGGVLTKK